MKPATVYQPCILDTVQSSIVMNATEAVEKALAVIKKRAHRASPEKSGWSFYTCTATYSELQPIEMVWSKVKGDVGRQYITTTTFKDVRARLDAAFASLAPSTISNTIAHSTYMLLDLRKDIQVADDAHDQDPSSSDESGGDVSSADSDLE